jgi:N4-gp56 family major capsid protein
MTTQVTTGLTQEMMLYYESVFLDRAQYELVNAEGGQKKSMQSNLGKSIVFTRYTPLATVTTALSEAANPSEVDLTAANVSTVLSEFGTTVKIGKFLSLTSIDANNKEKIEVVGQNMGETLNELVRNELDNGTVQLAGAKSNITAVAASDTFNAAEVQKAVRTLEGNKAMVYPDGFYIGKVQPFTKYDLIGTTTWINAKTYSDVKDLYKGEMGELYQVRFLNNKNGKTTASTVTVYHNYIHGANAFGVYDLEQDQPKLYIKTPGDQDTSNPANRYSTVAWAGAFVTKILNSNWSLVVKTGATA